MEPTKCAVIYTRFSPRPNGGQSESCETQLAYCEQYAHKRGYQVAGHYDDKNVSGADEDRPKMWQAIDNLKKGGVLLVMKLDRLARNVYLMELIRRAVTTAGATIEAVSGDVEGTGPEVTMIRQVLASIAEYERRIIALRTSYAMRYRQKQGQRMGRFAPYGLTLQPDGTLVPNETEAATVRIIEEMGKEGCSIAAIHRRMNRDHAGAARNGKQWDYHTIKRILRRSAPLSA